MLILSASPAARLVTYELCAEAQVPRQAPALPVHSSGRLLGRCARRKGLMKRSARARRGTDERHNAEVTFGRGALPFSESQFNGNEQRSVCLGGGPRDEL